MIAEELRQNWEDCGHQYDRRRQWADKNPSDISRDNLVQDALVEYQAAEIKMLRYAVKLLEGALRRRNTNGAPLHERD